MGSNEGCGVVGPKVGSSVVCEGLAAVGTNQVTAITRLRAKRMREAQGELAKQGSHDTSQCEKGGAHCNTVAFNLLQPIALKQALALVQMAEQFPPVSPPTVESVGTAAAGPFG